MKTELFTPEIWAVQLAPYRNWLVASNRPDNTVYLRIYHLRRFAVASKLAPFAVTLDDLLEHLNNDNWGNESRRSVRSSLRRFYQWAYVTGRINHDPSGLLPAMTATKGFPRLAPAESVVSGLAAKDVRVRFMVELGNRNGMRSCEIAVVHSADVLGAVGHRKLKVHGKGRKIRLVDIPEGQAVHILDAHGYVFPGQIDGHLSAGYVSKLLSHALGKLATGHMLRHSAITRVLNASGGQIRVAQKFAGHESSETTDIYAHVSDDSIRAATLAA